MFLLYTITSKYFINFHQNLSIGEETRREREQRSVEFDIYPEKAEFDLTMRDDNVCNLRKFDSNCYENWLKGLAGGTE